MLILALTNNLTPLSLRLSLAKWRGAAEETERCLVRSDCSSTNSYRTFPLFQVWHKGCDAEGKRHILYSRGFRGGKDTDL